jgi:hypothetical protein
MSPSVEQMKKGTCGCGRSPTGDCCGWHGLTEEQYQQRLQVWHGLTEEQYQQRLQEYQVKEQKPQ